MGQRVDLFPPDGLLQTYRPLILAQVRKYSQRYYLLQREVLPDALLLAHAAEEKFDPKRGAFSTLLLSELRRLNRVCQRMYRSQRIISRPSAEPEAFEKEATSRAAKQRSEGGRLTWQAEPRKGKLALRLDRLLGGIEPQRRHPVRNYERWKAAQGSEKFARLAKAAARVRPTLKTEKRRAVLDWMIGDLSGRDNRTMMRAASDIGITRGYASKVVCSIASQINCS